MIVKLIATVMLTGFTGAAACGKITETDSVVAGAWTYAGTQETPSPATLNGTVTWRGVSGGDDAFEGTFTVVQQVPGGVLQTISGPGAGEIISDTIADFDLTVSGVERRHIGILRGDSISGDWAVLTAGQSASGKFVLRRNR
jgi:hypothetical protein